MAYKIPWSYRSLGTGREFSVHTQAVDHWGGQGRQHSHTQWALLQTLIEETQHESPQSFCSSQTHHSQHTGPVCARVNAHAHAGADALHIMCSCTHCMCAWLRMYTICIYESDRERSHANKAACGRTLYSVLHGCAVWSSMRVRLLYLPHLSVNVWVRERESETGAILTHHCCSVTSSLYESGLLKTPWIYGQFGHYLTDGVCASELQNLSCSLSGVASLKHKHSKGWDGYQRRVYFKTTVCSTEKIEG